MAWLDDVLIATDYAETPKSFIKWGGLSALSAVIAPNVYLDKIFYKLSPNIFTMLLARSGLGKGFPVTLAKQLVEETHATRVISGRNSIQSMLQGMGQMRTQVNGNIPFKDSRAFLVSGEFADFITYDPQALIILTDLYDTHYSKDWKNTTKGQGIDVLKNPCLTMLGASSPIHFKNVIPESSIGGGFIARTLLVYEEQRSRINPLTEAPSTNFNISELAEYLKRAATIRGEFAWTKLGKLAFEEWYVSFRKRDVQDDTGTIERLHDHVLKIAMLLQVSRDCENLVLTEEAVLQAIVEVELLSSNAKKSLMVEGKSSTKEHIAIVLKNLFKVKDFSMSRPTLLQRAWGHINAQELDVAVVTLQQMGYVIEISKNNVTHYRLSERAIQHFISEAKGTTGVN